MAQVESRESPPEPFRNSIGSIITFRSLARISSSQTLCGLHELEVTELMRRKAPVGEELGSEAVGCLPQSSPEPRDPPKFAKLL